MSHRVQVFVSSTYSDLIAERQAAVQAILECGHIPAGMELFAAGDDSQWRTIQRWIDASDVFLLILGSRYGSVEPESGKSYVQLEYEYAVSVGKPIVSVVISDSARAARLQASPALEESREKSQMQDAFRQHVLRKISQFFDDCKDVKLAIHKSIHATIIEKKLSGWVRTSEVPRIDDVLVELRELRSERDKLRKDLIRLEKNPPDEREYNGVSYDELIGILKNTTLKIEINDPKNPSKKISLDIPLLLSLSMNYDRIAVGVENSLRAGDLSNFLFYNLAPKLSTYGLVEKKSLRDGIQRYQISDKGARFFAKLSRDNLIKKSAVEFLAKSADKSSSMSSTNEAVRGPAPENLSGETGKSSPNAVTNLGLRRKRRSPKKRK